MISDLIASLRDSIKSETELYTMRIQQQMNRYCSMLESVSVSSRRDSYGNENYQEQIDALKSAVNSIVSDLYKYKCGSVTSVDLNEDDIDVLPEPNLVVNKMHPEEIKEVHINFGAADALDSGGDDEEGVAEASDTRADSPVEIVIRNELVEPINHKIVEEVDAEEVEDAVEEVEVVDESEEIVEEDVAEDDEGEEDAEEEEAEEETEEELELEEIEWKGVKYYKDADDNVYEYLEDGEVGEAIGTLSKKIAGKVLLYVAA